MVCSLSSYFEGFHVKLCVLYLLYCIILPCQNIQHGVYGSCVLKSQHLVVCNLLQKGRSAFEEGAFEVVKSSRLKLLLWARCHLHHGRNHKHGGADAPERG